MFQLFLNRGEGFGPSRVVTFDKRIGLSEVTHWVTKVFFEDGEAMVAVDFTSPDEAVFFFAVGCFIENGAEMTNAIEAKEDARFVRLMDRTSFDEAGVIGHISDIAEAEGGEDIW